MRSEPRSAGRPSTPDEYLAGVRPEQRAALEKLRRTIRATVPQAEEGMSYGVPALSLEQFPRSKGAIRFQPDRPLPAALVRKLVRAQLARLGERS